MAVMLKVNICFYSCAGATYIKKMLMKNKKLQYLDIGGNKIDDDGVRHVTEGLQHNDTLTGLSLCNCEISLRGNYSWLTGYCDL